MKAKFETDPFGWQATLHVDEDAKNLITAPSCRGRCMEVALQALLGFEDYERFITIAKAFPLQPDNPRLGQSPPASSLWGIQLMVDL